MWRLERAAPASQRTGLLKPHPFGIPLIILIIIAAALYVGCMVVGAFHTSVFKPVLLFMSLVFLSSSFSPLAPYNATSAYACVCTWIVLLLSGVLDGSTYSSHFVVAS